MRAPDPQDDVTGGRVERDQLPVATVQDPRGPLPFHFTMGGHDPFFVADHGPVVVDLGAANDPGFTRDGQVNADGALRLGLAGLATEQISEEVDGWAGLQLFPVDISDVEADP